MNNKEKIITLLKGIETGDSASVLVVNEDKYVQHNPQTHEGSEGLAELFKRLSKSSPRVNIVRIFEDDDFVFAHTEYDFAHRNIGFEVFRFEDGRAVEHWDNIQRRQDVNKSGHSMVDGAVEVTDIERTEENRLTVKTFVDEVLLNHSDKNLDRYINLTQYIEHSPNYADDLGGFREMLAGSADGGNKFIRYKKLHRLLAEGNFVLSVCEGYTEKQSSSFYDLYRLKEGKIIEHWSTTEIVPPPSEWKNTNGKF